MSSAVANAALELIDRAQKRARLATAAPLHVRRAQTTTAVHRCSSAAAAIGVGGTGAEARNVGGGRPAPVAAQLQAELARLRGTAVHVRPPISWRAAPRVGRAAGKAQCVLPCGLDER
jgi:hypothetical protein